MQLGELKGVVTKVKINDKGGIVLHTASEEYLDIKVLPSFPAFPLSDLTNPNNQVNPSKAAEMVKLIQGIMSRQ
jgi:hypothetical protein